MNKDSKTRSDLSILLPEGKYFFIQFVNNEKLFCLFSIDSLAVLNILIEYIKTLFSHNYYIKF